MTSGDGLPRPSSSRYEGLGRGPALALDLSEERFRRLVEDLSVGILIQGPRSEVVFANHAAQELLGLSDAQLLGKTSAEAGSLTLREDGTVCPPEEHPGPRALSSGRPVRNVVMGFERPSKGDRVWLLVSADPRMGPDGTVRQVILTLSDLTGHKEAEERLWERLDRPRRSVLVVEDNSVSQKVFVTMVENLGYHVEAAGNGLEAVEACSRAAFDAILMDCQMPEMDGFRATAWIREREGAERRTPIIALTASITSADREKCFAAGMDEYLGKPVALASLEATLRRWIPRGGVRPLAQGAETSRSVYPPDHPLRVLESLGRREAVVEIIDLFLDTTPQRLLSLREVLRARNTEALLALAHGLKGSAVQMGARGMAEACARIQVSARSGDLDGAAVLLATLEADFQAVSADLRTERRRLVM